ncbi:MAG TPA: hypothetical protein VMJ31_06190, partial [Methylocystis sp.]|nr:hypothetical protein [Methylocystis sp.]
MLGLLSSRTGGPVDATEGAPCFAFARSAKGDDPAIPESEGVAAHGTSRPRLDVGSVTAPRSYMVGEANS